MFCSNIHKTAWIVPLTMDDYPQRRAGDKLQKTAADLLSQPGSNRM
jgi:hypothetical protein